MENLADAFKAKPTLLVVDDEEGIREILSMTLDRMGAKFLEASSAQEALEVLQREKVDVVLSDIRMKGQTGLDLLSRCHVQGISVPFIFLTGYDAGEYMMRAVRLGAMDFIIKPISPDELHLTVSHVLAVTLRRNQIAAIIDTVADQLPPEKRKEMNELKLQIAMIRSMLAKKRDE